MDTNFPVTSDFINGYGFGEDGTLLLSDPNQYVTNWDDDFRQQYGTLLDPNYHPEPDDADPLGFALPVEAAACSTMTSVVADPSLEDIDFSETVKFISQVLMEENVEQRPLYDPLSLQVTEKSFYDALRDNNILLFPNQHPLDLQSPDGGTTSSSSNNSADSHELKPPSPDTPVSGDHANAPVSVFVAGDHVFQFNSYAISHTPSQPPSTSISDGLLDLDSSITKLLAQNMFSDADSVSQFRRGLEEASKFLPPSPQLVMVSGLEEATKFLPPGPEPQLETSTVSLESKRKTERAAFDMDKAVGEKSHGLKSRKNHEREGSDTEEGRSNKQSAVSGVVDESDCLSDMFDRVLLNMGNMPMCNEQENEPAKKPTSSDRGKARPKKQGKKKETIDLRTLLVLCAQAVSANDNRTANELLKQIRQHSSPFGDASQRLAHYFANGLEARLVGNAQGFATFFSSKRLTAAVYLKAYQVLMSACPFKKFTHFFANKMIMKAAINADTLHIIDFGILYGFQWPILIKFLSERDGGPPKLKITGIEFPQPGFRPTERIEETGRRLANYCERFKVPFEYNAIASRNWETIQVEDLKIESNELLAVNCLMRFKNLLDETIEVNSPRNAVLHLIRKINPDIFVQSIVNGSYNAPFFATRFREALFHFSAIYDMLDTVMSRERENWMIVEKEIVGREAMNVVACEGFERVERPETYKQWQVRNSRAGFKQLPLNEELMAKFRAKLRGWYHRDFVLDEDNNWMLQGWKGRILYASTCWVPA